MLLLYVFLLSCCFSGSMGRATEEFKENFEILMDLAKKEDFIPVPAERLQYNCIPCYLERTVEWLKSHFTANETRRHRIEKNMNHIITTLNKRCTKSEQCSSCPMREVPPQSALKIYKKLFSKLHEMCL